MQPAPDPSSQVVVITGAASAGIGKAVLKHFYAENASIISVVRPERARQHAQEFPGVDVRACDFSQLEDVRALAHDLTLSVPCIDRVIHSVGIMHHDSLKTEAGLDVHYLVNAIAPWLFTRRLVEPLRAAQNARVVAVGSAGVERATNAQDGLLNAGPCKMFNHYFNSKEASYFLMMDLQREFDGLNTGINTYLVDPGLVRTELGRSFGAHGGPLAPLLKMGAWMHNQTAMAPEQAAKIIYAVATQASFATLKGKYFGAKISPQLRPLYEALTGNSVPDAVVRPIRCDLSVGADVVAACRACSGETAHLAVRI